MVKRKTTQDLITELENKRSKFNLLSRSVKRRLEIYQPEIVADILKEYESGKIIISRVSDWQRLELDTIFPPQSELHYFTKLVYFHFSISYERPAVTKVLDLERIEQSIASSFADPSSLHFTSHAKMDIVDQCQRWLDSIDMLNDKVVWCNEERTNGLACHGVEYIYTSLPKE
jgi:hypothetical protein